MSVGTQRLSMKLESGLQPSYEKRAIDNVSIDDTYIPASSSAASSSNMSSSLHRDMNGRHSRKGSNHGTSRQSASIRSYTSRTSINSTKSAPLSSSRSSSTNNSKSRSKAKKSSLKRSTTSPTPRSRQATTGKAPTNTSAHNDADDDIPPPLTPIRRDTSAGSTGSHRRPRQEFPSSSNRSNSPPKGGLSPLPFKSPVALAISKISSTSFRLKMKKESSNTSSPPSAGCVLPDSASPEEEQEEDQESFNSYEKEEEDASEASDIIVDSDNDDEEKRGNKKLHGNATTFFPPNETDRDGFPATSDGEKDIATNGEMHFGNDFQVIRSFNESQGESSLPRLEVATDQDYFEERSERALQQANEEVDLFSANWKAGFTLQSDNAGGHFEDEEGIEGDDGDNSENDNNAWNGDDDGNYNEKEEDGSFDFDDEQEDEQSANEGEDEENFSDYSDEDSDKKDQRHSATQALLQFNYNTPDGLDYAMCDQEHDQASIFRMGSDRTLQVPDYTTTELTDFDKQLLYVKGKSRNAKFATKLLKKNKNFKKKPKAGGVMSAAMKKAESFRIPSIGSSAHGKLHSTERSSHNEAETSGNQLQQSDSHERRRIDEDEESGDDEDDEDMMMEKSGNSQYDAMDRSAARRRRDVRKRRGTLKEKSQDEDRKERLRKRDEMRRAASTRLLSQSHNDAHSKPHGSIRRKTSKGSNLGERRATIANFDSKPLLDETVQLGSKRSKTNASFDDDDVVNDFRRRSTLRKAQSMRQVKTSLHDKKEEKGLSQSRRSGPSDAKRSAMQKAQSVRQMPFGRSNTVGATDAMIQPTSLRRATSAGSSKPHKRRDSTAMNSSRRRQSEGERRHRQTRHESGKTDVDRSRRHDMEESGQSQSSDRRHSEMKLSRRLRRGDHGEAGEREMNESRRRARRAVTGEAPSNELDQSRRKSRQRKDGTVEMDRSGENHNGGRIRGDRRQSRRARPNENTEKSKGNIDGTGRRRHIEGSGSRSGRGDIDKSRSRRRGKSVSGGERMKSFKEDAVDWDEPVRGVKASSSLTVERSPFEGSFSDLAVRDEGEVIGDTHHFNGGASQSDRRKSFMKSLSVRIPSNPQGIGKGARKGARNLIVGGTRTEKKRLLAADDESIVY